MSEKKFTKFELARMKRTAQNVDQYITKKNKLVTKIAELQAELDGLNSLIELTDAPTKAMTGGYGTEDIIKKVVTPTDKLDKNGNVVKITSYEFLYPETIIPVAVATEEAEEVAEETEAAEPAGYTVVEETAEEA
jgi:hypothetical protein